MDIKTLKEYLGQDWIAVQNRISSALKSDISLLNSTNGSILSNSGKQLRPLLSLVLARACKPGEPLADAAIRYAAASELLHNATLHKERINMAQIVKKRWGSGIFSVLQRVGRAFMLPIALLPIAGLLLGIGASLTNEAMLEAYNLMGAMGPGTFLYSVFSLLASVGTVIFDNLPLLFAMDKKKNK